MKFILKGLTEGVKYTIDTDLVILSELNGYQLEILLAAATASEEFEYCALVSTEINNRKISV